MTKTANNKQNLPQILPMISDTPARCTGCSACVNTCPTSALIMRENDEGFLYPDIDSEKCINCHACDRACPSLAIYPEAFAYWNDDAIRQASSSGGAFTALAMYVFKHGGSVFGAAYDYEHDGLVHHIEVTDPTGLPKIQKSKYAQSSMGDAYARALNRLKEGRMVLFVGTPCQTAGFLRAGAFRKREHLILVDFICHGVPSPRVWTDYVKKRMPNRQVKRIDMREQNLSWERFCLELTDASSKQYLAPHNQDPYIESFLQDIILRPSCYQCPHRLLQRDTDFTLADFWGVDKIMAGWNDHQGTSLILCHNAKAKNLLKKLPGRKEHAPLEEALRYNSAAQISPALPQTKRQAFFAGWQQNHDDILSLLDTATRAPSIIRAYRRLRYIMGSIYRRLANNS